MTRIHDVCIRGGGIVGRTLALHLAAQRLSVALVAADTPAAGAGDVRAYALNQASRTLLERIRCWPAPAFATAVAAMEIQEADGGHLRFSAQEQGVDALTWIVDVPELERLLSQAVQFQPLIDLAGTAPPATLTVVCEGRASSSRDEFGVAFDATPYHQHALAARVRGGVPHGQTARQWFSRGEILALLPLEGPDGHTCALVWSVAPERASALQSMPEAEFCAALAHASHGALGATGTLCSERMVWPLQTACARQWSGQTLGTHWVLAGDAAHTVHPLAGQGLNLGLGDVAELTQRLSQRAYWRPVNDPQPLRAYERARKAALALVGGSGDTLQQLFQHPHPAVQQLRNLGMRGVNRCAPLKHWLARQAMGGVVPPLQARPQPPTQP